MEKSTRQRKWIWIAASVLVCVLMALSMFHFQGFVAKTGKLYRKRMLIYMLPSVLAVACSCWRPRVSARYAGIFSALLLAAAVVLGAAAFQNITWGDSWDHVPGFELNTKYIPLILSLTAVIFMLVWAVIWDLRAAIVTGYLLLCVCGYLYQCVFLFRGVTFKPLDVLMIGTAWEMAGNYSFPFQVKHAFWLSCGMLLLVLCRWIPRRPKTGWKGRVIKLACLAAAGAWMYVLLFTSHIETFKLGTTAFEEASRYYNSHQGTLPTLLQEVWNLRKQKPEDYDAQALQSALLSQNPPASGQVDEERPHVIVIVNESFSDLSTMWDFETNQDPLAFFHSLQGKAVYGDVYVSSYGGITCNTEHNFLTGTPPPPQIFMPLFATVTQETPSLAWQMKALGYSTYAMHPAKATNYQRQKIYPLLGFDTFLSREYFAGCPMREGNLEGEGFVLDQACYERLIALYEEKSANEKLFIYALTIQNHGPYPPSEIDAITVTDGSDPQLEAYLSCAYQSDQALKELIGYFESRQEPVVVLFFGDHQPAVRPAGQKMSPSLTDAEKRLIQYRVPFVIWANYPIEAETADAMSINYLAAYFLKKAGLPLNAYDQYQLEVMQEYPLMVQSGYMDRNGIFHEWGERADWPQELRMMDQLRYNRLYDPNNRLPALGIAE